jgi:hypothetical protein
LFPGLFSVSVSVKRIVFNFCWLSFGRAPLTHTAWQKTEHILGKGCILLVT